jgi:hypothetical protein
VTQGDIIVKKIATVENPTDMLTLQLIGVCSL